MDLLFSNLLVVIRVAAAVMVAPMFFSRFVPLSFRVPAAIVIGLAVCMMVSGDIVSVNAADGIARLIVTETFLGLLLGGGVALVFSSVNLVGEVITHMTGMRWMADKYASDEMPPAERLLWFVSLSAFILLRGPECFLLQLVDTFHSIPIGGRNAFESHLETVTMLLHHCLWLSLYTLGPILATFYACSLLLALLTRLIPQLNGVFSGLNINVILFWGALFLTISGGVWILQDDPASLSRLLVPSIAK